MADLLPVTRADQIAELEREAKMREAVYPRFVQAKRFTQDEADRRSARLRAAIATLQSQNQDFRSLLKSYMSRVIGDDHVVGLKAVEFAPAAEKPVLIEIGREIGERDGDQWMWERLGDV